MAHLRLEQFSIWLRKPVPRQWACTRRCNQATGSLGYIRPLESQLMAVRLEGADYQSRKIPSGEMASTANLAAAALNGFSEIQHVAR